MYLFFNELHWLFLPAIVSECMSVMILSPAFSKSVSHNLWPSVIGIWHDPGDMKAHNAFVSSARSSHSIFLTFVECCPLVFSMIFKPRLLLPTYFLLARHRHPSASLCICCVLTRSFVRLGFLMCSFGRVSKSLVSCHRAAFRDVFAEVSWGYPPPLCSQCMHVFVCAQR